MKFDDFINNKSVSSTTPTQEIREVKAESEEMDSRYRIKPENEQSRLNVVRKPILSTAQVQERKQMPSLELLQQNLVSCMKIVDDVVMKGYLTKLDSDDVAVNEADTKEIEQLKDIQFFRITEIVYQEGEFSLHKLATVFNTLGHRPCTLVMMIKSDGNTNEFYLGVRSRWMDSSSGTMREMLKQSLAGMFPGSHGADYYADELEKDIENMELGALSSVTCVADFRQDVEGTGNNQFVQGIEKFIDSMHGKSYRAIFVADSIGHEELVQAKREYENICTQIAPFVDMQMSFSTSSSSGTSTGETEGNAQSQNYNVNQAVSTNTNISRTHTTTTAESDTVSDSKGETDTTSEGNSKTKGLTHGKSSSTSEGTSTGVHAGIGGGSGSPLTRVGKLNPLMMIFSQTNAGFNYNKSTTTTTGESHSESCSDTISKTLSHGISNTRTIGKSRTTSQGDALGESTGEGRTSGTSYSVGSTVNFATSRTLTDTLGTSQGITLNARNLSLQSMVERLEKQLKRIEECESFGMWNFAAYFVGTAAADTASAANVYRSVVSGTKSGIECSAINTWTDDEKLRLLTPYVKNFLHPRFRYQGFDNDGTHYTDVTPAVWVSTKELTLHMGFPYHSVKGLPVIEHAAFAQEVLSKSRDEKKIDMGCIHHLGDDNSDTRVELDLKSLSMHTFITGSTGAGKSNAVYHLLSEAQKHSIPFLVVEPAKGEYRKVFTQAECFGTNPRLGDILQLNPFAFPAEIHVLEHVDRLVEIFNVCWPMESAMPSVLKESIEKAYIRVGWDIDGSTNIHGDNIFPSFADVDAMLNETIKTSSYSAEVQGNYIGALGTRMKSLRNGINGRIFTKQEMDLSLLFDQTAVLDLSRIGSMETKAFIMGIVVLKLQEYRTARAKEMNSPLKHLTVLEEAHNLLKKTSTEQSASSANVQGKSVEMITNMIAEIRTYGEGFVIVDQAPNLLDTAAIRNTNTKIVLRLPEGNDRSAIGASMALSEKQVNELSKLPTGVAAIYQNDWQEAVLCKIAKFDQDNLSVTDKPSLYERENAAIRKLLHNVLAEDKESLSDDERKLLRKWIDRLEATPMEKMVLLSALKGNDLTTRNKFVVVRIICSNVLRDNVLKRLKERSDCVKLMKKILKRRYDIQDEDIIMQQLDSVCTEVLSEILVKEKKTVKDKGDVSK